VIIGNEYNRESINMPKKESVLKNLEEISGVGKKIAQDL